MFGIRAHDYNYEMHIGYNGPDLAKADTMLKKAMNSYFKPIKK